MAYLVKKHLVPLLVAHDLSCAIVRKLRHDPEKKIPSHPRKVLFMRLEHIGDMILALPAFERFKRAHPRCAVHVLCRPLTAPLLKDLPYVDKVILFEAPWFLRSKRAPDEEVRRIINRLRQERYDAVFEMHGDVRSIKFAASLGAYTVGYACRGGEPLLDRIVSYDPAMPMIEQNLALIEPFLPPSRREHRGIPLPRLPVNHRVAHRVTKLLGRHGLAPHQFVLVHPRSGRPEKDLTDDEAIRICAARAKRHPPVVVAGSQGERELNRALARALRATDLTGACDLRTYVELVRQARMVIAPDTSVIHIAQAVGTPFSGIYKTTDERVWGYPRQNRWKGMRHAMSGKRNRNG